LRVWGQIGGAEAQLAVQNVTTGEGLEEIVTEGVFRVDSSGFDGLVVEADFGFSGLANVRISTVLG
jgi:hypothetical protein